MLQGPALLTAGGNPLVYASVGCRLIQARSLIQEASPAVACRIEAPKTGVLLAWLWWTEASAPGYHLGTTALLTGEYAERTKQIRSSRLREQALTCTPDGWMPSPGADGTAWALVGTAPCLAVLLLASTSSVWSRLVWWARGW